MKTFITRLIGHITFAIAIGLTIGAGKARIVVQTEIAIRDPNSKILNRIVNGTPEELKIEQDRAAKLSVPDYFFSSFEINEQLALQGLRHPDPERKIAVLDFLYQTSDLPESILTSLRELMREDLNEKVCAGALSVLAKQKRTDADKIAATAFGLVHESEFVFAATLESLRLVLYYYSRESVDHIWSLAADLPATRRQRLFELLVTKIGLSSLYYVSFLKLLEHETDEKLFKTYDLFVKQHGQLDQEDSRPMLRIRLKELLASNAPLIAVRAKALLKQIDKMKAKAPDTKLGAKTKKCRSGFTEETQPEK